MARTAKDCDHSSVAKCLPRGAISGPILAGVAIGREGSGARGLQQASVLDANDRNAAKEPPPGDGDNITAARRCPAEAQVAPT